MDVGIFEKSRRLRNARFSFDMLHSWARKREGNDMLSESRNMPGAVSLLLHPSSPGSSMVFLCQTTCEPKRNAQGEYLRRFPHLRPCQTRQPRGTKQTSERSAGQNSC